MYCRFVGASECLNYQKQTNADHIKSMSDEELAAIICAGCPPGEKYYICPTDGDGCGDCWFGWLQSQIGGNVNDM